MRCLTITILLALSFLTAGCGEKASDSKAPHSELVEITSTDQFAAEILNASLPCVVEFYASWCGPCRKLRPLLNELAPEWSGEIKFFAVNVDTSSDLARQYGVDTIPDVRFFKAGAPAGGAIGFRDRKYWAEEFSRLVARTPGLAE